MENIKNLRISNPEKLLVTLGITGIPDIVKVIKEFDLSVSTSWLDQNVADVKGFLEIKKRRRQIVINNYVTGITKRFISAYLFSDYQLNSSPCSDYYNILYDESIYDKKVYSYALHLLMPKFLFDEDLPYLQNYQDIQRLAGKYKVSEYLIRERGKMELKQEKLKEKRKGFTIL